MVKKKVRKTPRVNLKQPQAAVSFTDRLKGVEILLNL